MYKHCLPLLAFVSLVLTSSCKKEEEENNYIAPPQHVGNIYGVFVVNEGLFNASNGSISFYDINRGHVLSGVFLAANNRPLGDVVQSMNKIAGMFYIVVNNSQKVEVVNGTDFSEIATIGGLGSPRHAILAATGKVYISNWSDNSVKVVDTSTHTATKSIPAGSGPERMLKVGGKVYVVNSGGWGDDSTVTVIDTGSDGVINTLQVGRNPNGIVLDALGKVWIVCGGSIGPDWTGGTADDIAGSLWRLDPATDSVEISFMMAQSDHPLRLTVNKALDRLYYLNGINSYDGKVFSMGIGDLVIPALPVVNRTFYGLGIDPDNEHIYGASVPSFSQDGYLVRYTSGGTLLDSARVGIGPNGFYFNY